MDRRVATKALYIGKGLRATAVLTLLLTFVLALSGSVVTAQEAGTVDGAEGPNLVRNGGFEELADPDHPAEWRLRIEGDGYSVKVLEGVGVDGGRVVQLSGTQPVNGRAHIIQRDIPITEYRGKTLVLRGWYKGENVVASSHFLNVEFLNEEQNRLVASTVAINPPLGTTDWTLFEREFVVPEEAHYVWINANLLNGTGTIWWDNVELREGQAQAEPLSKGDNLLYNPTFIGAERMIPPPGWALYGSLSNGHRIELVNAEDPEQCALLIDDRVSIPRGNEGEIGLTQLVSAEPGRHYRATVSAAGLLGEPTEAVYLQLRFVPSNTFQQIGVTPLPGVFHDFTIDLIAPEDTHGARVYLYTSASGTPKILIRSITLTEVDD